MLKKTTLSRRAGAVSGPARLQACVEVAVRLRRNHCAPREGILAGANHFQVHGAVVARVYQHPAVAQKVNIAPPAGLQLRRTGGGAHSRTIENVHMPDSRHDLVQRFAGRLASPVNVARIHVNAKCRGINLPHGLQGRGGVPDRRADMGLHAQADSKRLRPLRHVRQHADAPAKAVWLVLRASRTDIDHRDPEFRPRLKGLHKAVFIECGFLHRREGKLQIPGERLDLARLGLPVVQVQMFAHPLDRRDLRRIEPRPLDMLRAVRRSKP